MLTIPHKRPGVKNGAGRGEDGRREPAGREHQARNRQRKRDWENLRRKHAPGDLEATAQAQEAILRKRKIRVAGDLLRLAMAYALTDMGLRGVAAWAAEVGLATLSSEGVRKRLKRANTWVAHLVALQLLGRHSETDALPRRTVVIQDATFLSVPGSKGVSHRVHVVLDLVTERITRIDVTDDKGGETLARFPFRAGELVMGDRIYGTSRSIAAVCAAGADPLVRLRWNVPLRNADGEALNLAQEARKCPTDGPLEIEAWTTANAKTGHLAIKTRVIICRLSPEAGERGRRNLRREMAKKGYTPSADALDAQDYLFLLTTVSAEELPAEGALALYRLRWKVEICFKRQKSVLELDEVKAKTPALVETVLYTKILAALWEQECLWQWAAGFLAEVPDPDAVRLPHWRMMCLLRKGLLAAVGVNVGIEEWLSAPAEVTRPLIEPPRKRTRDMNARIKITLAMLGGAPTCA